MEIDVQVKYSRITETEANSPAREAWVFLTRLHAALISHAQLHVCSSHLRSSKVSLQARWWCTHPALGAHSPSRAVCREQSCSPLPGTLSQKALPRTGLGQRNMVKTPGEGNQQNPKWEKCSQKNALPTSKNMRERVGGGTCLHPEFYKQLDEAIKKVWALRVYLVRNYC